MKNYSILKKNKPKQKKLESNYEKVFKSPPKTGCGCGGGGRAVSMGIKGAYSSRFVNLQINKYS